MCDKAKRATPWSSAPKSSIATQRSYQKTLQVCEYNRNPTSLTPPPTHPPPTPAAPEPCGACTRAPGCTGCHRAPPPAGRGAPAGRRWRRQGCSAGQYIGAEYQWFGIRAVQRGEGGTSCRASSTMLHREIEAIFSVLRGEGHRLSMRQVKAAGGRATGTTICTGGWAAHYPTIV